jgi:ribose 5-phosphate isomerase B
MPEKKRFILGADHAGFALKEALRRYLQEQKIRVEDASPIYKEDDDYPAVAKRVAKAVSRDLQAQGLLVCGSGFGMSMAANRIKGARAATARSSSEARLAREDTHANILALGSRVTPTAIAKKILDAWLAATPSKAERHLRRIKQLDRDVK